MFGRLIEDCRKHVARGQGGWLRRLGFAPTPLRMDPRDDVPASVRPHYEQLLREGEVVWGHVVMANRALYEPGDRDHPGNVVYSPKAHFDEHPEDLTAIAHAVYALKDTAPDDPALAEVAATISDDYNGVEKQRLPKALTGGRVVYLAWTIFHRSRLPKGYLADRLVPLLICPKQTPANMVLPLPYWPRELAEQWGRLDQVLAQVPGQRPAPAVRAAPRRRERDTEEGPVSVTPRAARKIQELAARAGMAPEFYVAVSTVSDQEGTRHKVDLAPTWDRERELCFESRGLRILIPRDQEHALQGAVVDFRESIYGSGFIVRRQDS
jgi:Fe-S cluster assembly iron-binding protein IscA